MIVGATARAREWGVESDGEGGREGEVEDI